MSPAADTPAPVPMVSLTARIWLTNVPALLLGTIRLILIAEMVLFLAATGLSAFKDTGKHKAFARVVAFQTALEQPGTSLLKRNVPTNFRGTDISRWLLLLLVYIVSIMLGGLSERFSDRVDALRRSRERAGGPGGEMEDLQKSLEAIGRGEKLDRRKLLQIYTETKRTLEGQKRHLAFVSIDVVDSTGMKLGESAEVAERDFILYKKLVERSFHAHHALKSTWTPDGVMSCFSTAENAVEAGLGVLGELEHFNASVKAIKHDFALRIGINAGEVSFDDDTPMEEMTDRVIDIAGHMQKHGAVNALSATKQAATGLPARYGFKDAGRVVDGCEVFEARVERPV